MAESSSGIEFTGVLYGVVASNALFRLTPAVDLRNAMLLFAFGILAADWAEYRLSTVSIPDTLDTRLRQFGLDMLILVVWAFLPVVPATALPTYVGVVAAFVTLQGVWDAVLSGTTGRGVLVRAEWELAAAYGALLVVDGVAPLPSGLLFAVTVGLFLGLKAPVWLRLYRRTRRTETPASI